jgi:putative transposase
LHRKPNIKDQQFPWVRELTKNAPLQAIKNLGTVFRKVFAGTGKSPQFKKQGQRASFGADKWSGSAPSVVHGRSLLSAAIEHAPPVRESQALRRSRHQGSRDIKRRYATHRKPKAGPLKRLKRRSRSLKPQGQAPKVKGAANRLKAKAKRARLHARILRRDALQRLTADLVITIRPPVDRQGSHAARTGRGGGSLVPVP